MTTQSADPSQDLFYVANLSHLKRSDRHITFWRPDAKGYAFPLSWSGKYSREQIEKGLDYYHTGRDNIAVHCSVVDSLGSDPKKGCIDGDAGPVVLNTEGNWKQLLAGMIQSPEAQPWPLWPGRRNEPKPVVVREVFNRRESAALSSPLRERGG